MKTRNFLYIGLLSLAITELLSCGKDNNSILYETTRHEYTPLIKEGKLWAYGSTETGPNFWEYLSEDTVINGQKYLKLCLKTKGFDGITYEAALREENKKIFCVLPDETVEWLAYDFGLKAGQRFWESSLLPWLKNHEEYGPVSATLVGEGCYDADLYQYTLEVVQTSPMDYPNKTVWIEGVGACNFPMYHWTDYQITDPNNPFGGRAGFPLLYYCEYNGVRIYQRSERI